MDFQKELERVKQLIELDLENSSLKEEYRITRNKYFQVIKTIKKNY